MIQKLPCYIWYSLRSGFGRAREQELKLLSRIFPERPRNNHSIFGGFTVSVQIRMSRRYRHGRGGAKTVFSCLRVIIRTILGTQFAMHFQVVNVLAGGFSRAGRRGEVQIRGGSQFGRCFWRAFPDFSKIFLIRALVLLSLMRRRPTRKFLSRTIRNFPEKKTGKPLVWETFRCTFSSYFATQERESDIWAKLGGEC